MLVEFKQKNIADLDFCVVSHHGVAEESVKIK